MWWSRGFALGRVVGVVHALTLCGEAVAAAPVAQLTFTPLEQGRFKLTNQTPGPVKVTLSAVPRDFASIRVETLTNGECNRNPKVLAAPLDLIAGESRCVWARGGQSSAPVVSPDIMIRAETVGGDQLSAEIVTNVAAPLTMQAVPVAPATTVEKGLFAPWITTAACAPLSSQVSFLNPQGNDLQACLTPAGKLTSLLPAQPTPGPGVYTNKTAYTTGGQAAAATITVRRPWWYAAFFIVLGLLLPALLRFIADRHREKEALKLAVAEEGLVLAAPGPVGAFQLLLPAGLVRPDFNIPVSQPFSDVRLASQALLQWRHLTAPRNIWGRLKSSLVSLNTQLGANYMPSWSRSPAHLLAFLGDVRSGARLELSQDAQTGLYQVPLSRAADVVASLEAARRLARTVERLDLPRLQKLLPARSQSTQDEHRIPFLLLERLIFEVAPVSASAKDIDAYTERVVDLGDAALSAALGASVAPVPAKLASATDSASVSASLASPGRGLLAANAAVRWFTLPLLLLALGLAAVVGINELWDKQPAWGQRGWLDYIGAMGVGAAAFLAAGLAQTAVGLLSGSALVPGLLRKLRL